MWHHLTVLVYQAISLRGSTITNGSHLMSRIDVFSFIYLFNWFKSNWIGFYPHLYTSINLILIDCGEICIYEPTIIIQSFLHLYGFVKLSYPIQINICYNKNN